MSKAPLHGKPEVPTSNYVSHYDPSKSHHRAWLQAVLDRLVQNADFQLIEQQIHRGIPVPCGYIHRGHVDRPTGSGHWLIVYGHTPTQVVVNDPWGEPDLIHGTTLNADGMGLRFSRLNYRYAGLRLRQALDGGAHWWRRLALCTGQGLGGGGGTGRLIRNNGTAAIACAGPDQSPIHNPSWAGWRRAWIRSSVDGLCVGSRALWPLQRPGQQPGPRLGASGRMNLQALAGGLSLIPEARMSTPFVYYCKQDPWQDDLDGNHGLPVLLARRSNEPGSEAMWRSDRQAWEPFPDLLERLLGGDWWEQLPKEQAQRYFGEAAVAGGPIVEPARRKP